VYLKDFDAGVRWNDADIGVDWPISGPTLSAKDEAAPFLKDIAEDRLPVYTP
ncbi:dTDP-4-dehydrorhamnose 3,5-epimerase, partial [Listeria monocytogenes]